MNYDNDYLGTGNINHPANERDLTDREMLTEVYNVSKEVLEIFDRVNDDRSYYGKVYVDKVNELVKIKTFIYQIKETLSASDNGMCIVVRNQIENFLNK